MRAKNREVNIFNMSLLDILCGALGAFCFMMLVLFPYWKPKGASSAEVERKYQTTARELDELQRQIEKLPGGAADLAKRLEKLSRDFQQQKAMLDQARRDAQRALQEAQQANKERDNLRMREPFLVSMNWTSPGLDVDLYVRSRAPSVKGTRAPPVDPGRKQGVFFEGDIFVDVVRGPATDSWLVRDNPERSEFEIYYKFLDAKGSPGPAVVNLVSVDQTSGYTLLPGATLSKPGSATMVGVLRRDDGGKMRFHPQPEYAAEFERLNRKQPPSVPGTK